MEKLNCDRKGCDNTEAYRFSEKYGNICYNCFEELIDKSMENGGPIDIRPFMESPSDELGSLEERYSIESYYETVSKHEDD